MKLIVKGNAMKKKPVQKEVKPSKETKKPEPKKTVKPTKKK